MKKLLILFPFLFCAADAFSFALTADNGLSVGISKIIDGSALNICIIAPQPEKEILLSRSEAKKLLSGAFDEWTRGVAKRIRDAGRAEGFEDVLKILDRQVKINFTDICDVSDVGGFAKTYPRFALKNNSSAPDLRVFITDYFGSMHIEYPKTQNIILNYPLYVAEKGLILHETGHYLGFNEACPNQVGENDHALYFSDYSDVNALMCDGSAITDDEVDAMIVRIDEQTRRNGRRKEGRVFTGFYNGTTFIDGVQKRENKSVKINYTEHYNGPQRPNTFLLSICEYDKNTCQTRTVRAQEFCFILSENLPKSFGLPAMEGEEAFMYCKGEYKESKNFGPWEMYALQGDAAAATGAEFDENGNAVKGTEWFKYIDPMEFQRKAGGSLDVHMEKIKEAGLLENF